MAQKFNEPINVDLSVVDWPWTWVRVAYYVMHIQSVHERAHILSQEDPDRATPPRWMMFNNEALELWFKSWKGNEGAHEELIALVGSPNE